MIVASINNQPLPQLFILIFIFILVLLNFQLTSTYKEPITLFGGLLDLLLDFENQSLRLTL